MINFQHLYIEGFGSIAKPLEYSLDEPGVTILLGHNGAGKSTIPAAILWVLKGKLIGKEQVETWEDLRPKNFRGTKVSLRFSIGGTQYKITRCHKYEGKIFGSKGSKRLILEIDEEYREDLRNKGDVQKVIDEILPLSLDVLTSSIILGQNLTRILDATGEKQKSIMDEAFNTLYIKRAQQKAKDDLKKASLDYAEVMGKYEGIKGSLENQKERLGYAEEAFENFNKTKEKDLRNAKASLSEATKTSEAYSFKKLDPLKKAKLEKLRKKLLPTSNAYDKIEKEAFRLELKIEQTQGEILDLIQEAKELMDSKAKTCSTCGQRIKNNVAHAKKEAQNKITESKKFRKELEGMQNELIGLETSKNNHLDDIERLKETEKKLEQIESDEKAIEAQKNAKATWERMIEAHKKRIEEIENRTFDDPRLKIKKKLKKLKNAIKEPKELKDKLKKRIEMLEWLIKDPLSNKGLKTYIFNQLLDNISDRTRYYEGYSGIAIDFDIDLDAASKPLIATVYLDGKARNYKGLSGGQKQLANITASFAIHDVIAENNAINILFLDEIFENLDKRNIQVISDLISFRSETQALHLITHRSEFSIYNSRILEFKLGKDKTTKMAN